jgi:hypothetical protein
MNKEESEDNNAFMHATAHSCTALVCSMVESPPRLTVGLQQQKTITSYVKSCRSTSPQPGFIATAERQRMSCAAPSTHVASELFIFEIFDRDMIAPDVNSPSLQFDELKDALCGVS